MASVNNEGTNTQKMRQHQLTRSMKAHVSTTNSVDLVACLDIADLNLCTILNRDYKYGNIKDILYANPTDKFIVSDVDEQMILNIVFKETVCISSISVRASNINFENYKSVKEKNNKNTTAFKNQEHNEEDAKLKDKAEKENESFLKEQTELKEEMSGPRDIYVFSNMENIDFSEVEGIKSYQKIELDESSLEGNRISLRGVMFQRSKSVQIFIKNNQRSSSKTFINRIVFHGYIAPPYAN